MATAYNLLMRSFLLFIAVVIVLPAFAQQKAATENPVPVISGDLGDCSATFTVTNTKMKPIYNAKIDVELRYGFGGFHRTSLEVATNVDGKARVEGLPQRNKRPLAFTASYEGRKTVVLVDVDEQCHGNYSAIVTDKAVKTEDEDAE
jgi:hypothetical protein